MITGNSGVAGSPSSCMALATLAKPGSCGRNVTPENPRALSSLKHLAENAPEYHEKLVECQKYYYCAGSMPECVSQFAVSKDLAKTRDIQNQL